MIIANFIDTFKRNRTVFRWGHEWRNDEMAQRFLKFAQMSLTRKKLSLNNGKG